MTAPSTASLAPGRAMSQATVVTILALLLGIQPVTTDLYLPALPALTGSFGAGPAQAQLTLTMLMLAFGASQLVWGPLSDRFGRRPVLLCGLGSYVVASVGCVLAPTMDLLVFWRSLQGLAMGAAVMCARALVRDLYEPAAGARAMSRGLSGLGVIACLGPALGGLLADWYGWRVALSATAVFGAVAFIVVAGWFEETLHSPGKKALDARALAATWSQIVRHPTFLAYSALATASYAGLFTFLASSSFVFIQVLGFSRIAYGFVMFTMALAYLAGTFVCRRLLPWLGLRRTVAVAGALSLAGGTLVGVFALVGWHNGWAILLPFCLFMVAHGIHQPCGQSGAVGPFPQAAGAASALSGFLMMLAAFGVGGWVGASLDGTVHALSNGLWFWGAAVAAVAWTLVQRHG